MFKSEIDARPMLAELSELELQQFPFALATALNDTGFQDVRPGWKDEMMRVFDRPTRLTINAVLVNKANKRQAPVPYVEIYLRNEATQGTPPARYLEHQVEAGTRPKKPFENILIRSGVMSPDEFAVPGKSYPLDAHGNVPARVVQSVLKDLNVARGDDTSGFSTPESRRRRERRRKKRGGIYFLSRGRGTDLGSREQNLPRGIYERVLTGFGSAVRTVFKFVGSVRYSERFEAYNLAEKLFYRNFPRRFDAAMKKAIATAKRKRR